MRLAPVALCLAAVPLVSQEAAPLTLEKLFHPAQQVKYLETQVPAFTWMPDGRYLETRKGQEAKLVDPRTGAAVPFLDTGKLLKALAAVGAAEAKAKDALEGAAWTWNEAKDALLLNLEKDLYWAKPTTLEVRRLTRTPETEEEATFSPDGARVAFLRGNDLYAVDVADGKETRLTTGGNEHCLNGRLDYVYQEEIYGRGRWKAFWWAPDSQRLAYLSLDVAKVPTYVLPDDREVPQKLVTVRYSRAGDPIALARLGLVDLKGATQWMEHPYPTPEILTVQVGWDPAGKLLAVYQDRIQTWAELRRFEGTKSEVLLKETSPTWIERPALPRYLKDGSFLWETDTSGWHHLEHRDADGKLLRPVTAGEWNIRKVHGVDETRGRVYFDATLRSPIGVDVCRVDLKGKAPNAGLTHLSPQTGTHGASFDKAFTYYVDRWSDARTPARYELRTAEGQELRPLFDTALAVKELKLGEVRFQQVKTRDGFPMESMLILPPGFDPARKHPVFQTAYAGPGAATVRNAMLPLWYHFLASKGIVVWVCDNRSASGKGTASAHGIYRQVGKQELQDQLDGLEWLKTQGFADMDRICLEGYSYGGFFSGYALTHSKAWKLGVVGAPVTDWRLYDSAYTERYMGLPKDNPEGYDAADLSKSAKDLHGKLLLVHGTLDDNVHPQHTVRFLDALQKAGHAPLLALLPGSTHSPRAKPHQWAWYSAIWEFMEKNL